GTDVSAGAGLVLHDKGLAQLLLQLFRKDSGHQVRTGRRSERHHDPHRLGWPFCRCCPRPRRREKTRNDDQSNAFHCSLRAKARTPAYTSFPRYTPCLTNAACRAGTSTCRVVPLRAATTAAAVPAASPITKQAPDTRAADCPPCVIDAQRPTTNRLSTPRGSSIRYGRWLKPRLPGMSGQRKMTS